LGESTSKQVGVHQPHPPQSPWLNKPKQHQETQEQHPGITSTCSTTVAETVRKESVVTVKTQFFDDSGGGGQQLQHQVQMTSQV
jgi:hypothetical protein